MINEYVFIVGLIVAAIVGYSVAAVQVGIREVKLEDELDRKQRHLEELMDQHEMLKRKDKS